MVTVIPARPSPLNMRLLGWLIGELVVGRLVAWWPDGRQVAGFKCEV